MKVKIILKRLWIFVPFLFLVSCSALQSLNIFPVQQDVGLGAQFSNELQSSPKDYPIYNNPALKEYLTKNILAPILNSPEIKYKDIFKYQLEIVKNDSILNAFALPGGPMYVYTGLLKYLDSEAALAGVIAHEVAHAENRHATSRLTKAYGLTILQNLILGQNASQTSQLVASAIGQGVLLGNSRSDEDQSDEYSIKYLRSTKYYPGSVKFFFEKLRDDGKVRADGSAVDKFVINLLSTHPDPIARINVAEERLKAMGIPIKNYKSTDKDLFKADYEKNIRGKLR